jgi:hypothetical protein
MLFNLNCQLDWTRDAEEIIQAHLWGVCEGIYRDDLTIRVLV